MMNIYKYLASIVLFLGLCSFDIFSGIIRSGAGNTIISSPDIITISQAGEYILGSNIPQGIIIGATQVILDLNNYIVGVAIFSDSFNELIIKNGSLLGTLHLQNAQNVQIQNIFISSGSGISLDSCAGISISQVSIENSIPAISASNTQGLCIDNVFVQNCSIGCNLNTVLSFAIKNSQFILNGSQGINITSSEGLLDQVVSGTNGQGIKIEFSHANIGIANCKFLNNADQGMFLDQCSFIDIQDSLFEANGLAGAELDTTYTCLFQRCIMSKNTNGIAFTNSSFCSINKCIMQGNGLNGLSIGSSCVNNIISQCQSIGNLANGINLLSSSENNLAQKCILHSNFVAGISNSGTNSSIFQNKAQNNMGGNYVGVLPVTIYNISTGIFTPATPTAFDNISIEP